MGSGLVAGLAEAGYSGPVTTVFPNSRRMLSIFTCDRLLFYGNIRKRV